jgi:hypothetical protein
MSAFEFFTQVKQELRRRHAPFDAADLWTYCEAMAPLFEQERTPADRATAFLAEQRRPSSEAA